VKSGLWVRYGTVANFPGAEISSSAWFPRGPQGRAAGLLIARSTSKIAEKMFRADL